VREGGRVENLYIPGQAGSFPTPTADFDASNGVLAITGESHPEDAATFYAPLILWLETFTAGPPRRVSLELRLTFFSNTTRSQLLALLRRLSAFAGRGAEVRATWQVDPDDDDMVDTVADFEAMSGLKIEVVRASAPPEGSPTREQRAGV